MSVVELDGGVYHVATFALTVILGISVVIIVILVVLLCKQRAGKSLCYRSLRLSLASNACLQARQLSNPYDLLFNSIKYFNAFTRPNGQAETRHVRSSVCPSVTKLVNKMF